jgi:outer membrane protein
MMKRFNQVVLLLILAAAAAQAQTPATAPAPRQTAPAAGAVPSTPPVPGTKIAIMDFQGALLESDAGKAAQAEFIKQIDPEKSKFEKAQNDLAELQKKLQNAKTDAEKAPINRDIESKTRDAQRAQEDAQRMSDDLKQKLLPPVADLVNRMVAEYAKENNLAVVFDPSVDPSNIVFANKAADITAEIMRRMNAEYAKNPNLKAPAAPAAPAKPE